MHSKEHLWVVILIAGGRYLLDLYETALPQLWRAFQPVINKTRIGTVTEQAPRRCPAGKKHLTENG